MTILLIILGILAVGAGVFFLKKKNNKPSEPITDTTSAPVTNDDYQGYTKPSNGNDQFP